MITTTPKRTRVQSPVNEESFELRLEAKHKWSGGFTVQCFNPETWLLRIVVSDAACNESFEINFDRASPFSSRERAIGDCFRGLIEWADEMRVKYPKHANRLAELPAALRTRAAQFPGVILPERGIPETQAEASEKEAAAGNGTMVPNNRPAWKCSCGRWNDFLEVETCKCGEERPLGQVHERGSVGTLAPLTKKLKRAGKAAAADPVPASVGGELLQIPLGQIAPSPDNPRQTFDSTALAELAASIKSHGLLQPIVLFEVSGRKQSFEIIAGERRWRACELAGLPTVLARVLNCTAEEAIELRVIENLKREDLNAIDEARGFQQMIDRCGYTQRSLADRLSVSQGHIGNRLGLLKLPEVWQQRVITGEITPTMARELSPWASTLAFLKELDEWYAIEGSEEAALSWSEKVREIPWRISRPIGGDYFDQEARRRVQVCLSKKDLARADLDVREIPGEYNGQKPARRAFNVELWEELQAAALARKAKASSQKLDAEEPASETGRSPEAELKLREQQAKTWQKKLYRHKIAWLQRAVIAKLDPCVQFAGKADLLIKLLLHFNRRHDALKLKTAAISELAWIQVLEWLAEDFSNYHSTTRPEDFELLAADLEIDFAKEYRVDEELLQLANKAQLQSWIKEWKLEPGYSEKRSELIAELSDDVIGQKPAPKELAKVKPISLT